MLQALPPPARGAGRGSRVEGFAERLSRRDRAPPAAARPTRCARSCAGWIDRHPLPYLGACRYAGLPELFAGLRRHGKTIGVLSDYPAVAKLAALELAADFVVSACDRDIGCLKPDPSGLRHCCAAPACRPIGP